MKLPGRSWPTAGVPSIWPMSVIGWPVGPSTGVRVAGLIRTVGTVLKNGTAPGLVGSVPTTMPAPGGDQLVQQRVVCGGEGGDRCQTGGRAVGGRSEEVIAADPDEDEGRFLRDDGIDLGDRSAQDELRQLLHATCRFGDGARHGEGIRDVCTGDADVVERTAEGRVQRRSLEPAALAMTGG